MSHQMWLCFCVFAIFRYCEFGEGRNACCPEPCQCSGNLEYVSCVGKGLTYIPPLPSATRNLNMSGNILQRLTSFNNTNLLNLDLSNNSISIIECLNDLNNLTYLNLSRNKLENLKEFSNVYLKELDVSNNVISKIEPDSLEKLINLTYLNLSGNKLGSNLNLSLMRFPTSLSELHLNNLALENLTDDLLENLSNTTLTVLSLRNNNIKTFKGPRVFSRLTQLKKLDLSFNNLTEFTMSQSKSLECLWLSKNKLENVPDLHSSDKDYAPELKHLALDYNRIRKVRMNYSNSLEFLSFSSNQLTGLPICCSDNTTLLPNLRNLFVDDNCIRELKMERINCLSNLTLFNISATKIGKIDSNTFSQLVGLETLVMEFLQKLQSLKPHAFNSSSLKRLFIRGNHFLFTPRNVNQIFDSCPHVTNLDLAYNDMVSLRHDDWNFVDNMKNLTYLDISYNSILYLPLVIPNKLKYLKTFHFESNDASYIPSEYFNKSEYIESLLMNNNKFSVIHRNQLPKNLTRLKKVNLSFNAFECNCELLWFISFARKLASEGRLYRYPQYYNCGNVRNMSIDDARISSHGCLLRQEINMTIRCTCWAVISLFVLFSIVYRYRWRLRYFIYILNYHRRKYSQPAPQHINDVYVSCSEKDFDFVSDNIVEKMEKYGLKIYFPERDAVAGSLKVSSTIDTIDTSSFVLVCLSDSYAQDHWCEFEACMAIERSVCERRRTLIVIVLEEICSINVTKWDVDNERNNEDNWRRLMNEIVGDRPDVVIN